MKRGGGKGKNSRHNDELSYVYADTQKYFEQKPVLTAPSRPYDIRTLDIKPLATTPESRPCQVVVENSDTLNLTLNLKNNNLNPLVLNMASDYCPGGGVAKGARAQEEDIFRRTNYFQVLPRSQYPLESWKVIYSPLVHICKNDQYKMLKPATDSGNPCVPISCIAVAALRHPKIRYENRFERYYNPQDKEIMEKKIEAIFQIGLANGHDSLVLGALGCGVFQNPIHDVVDIYRRMIEKYRTSFKVIAFGVLVCKATDQQKLLHIFHVKEIKS